jgi:SHS2 domain-containing protein
LLASWVNECLYVHEVEGFVVCHIDVTTIDDRVVHGVLTGEEIDRSRHRPGTVVKGATLHQLEVTETAEAVRVRVIVDV